MTYRFESPCGVAVERRDHALPYAEGIDFVARRLNARRGAFFSSGVEDPDRYSRWDMGFTDPPLELVGSGSTLTVNALSQRGVRLLAILQPLLSDGPETRIAEQAERRLVLEVERGEQSFPEEERSRQPSVITPIRRLLAAFDGIADGFLGLYGAFGYDLIFQFEPMALRHPRAETDRNLHLYLPDRFYLMDRRKEVATRFDYDFAHDDLHTSGAADAPFEGLPPAAKAAERPNGVVTDVSDEAYMAMVEAARERMHAGDIFEVVLSRRFTATFDGDPCGLYHLMRRINPSPYEFLIQLGRDQLIGASPEMFVRIEGDRVESCPISGTIRRGADAMEDAERIRELYNSEKDEVELTMCTDVDRNDKSRICRPGTVRLLSRRLIERYAGLFHTVDHVEGRLREGFTGLDAFLSHMWAVTLTGAPKPMAIRLVEQMEAGPRGWYGGAVGALLLNGDVNTGITIRTVHLSQGLAHYQAGATLVWDSDPAAEEQETRIKATAFFRALDTEDARPAAAAPQPAFAGVRVVMIDNEDSFVHTLADYFRQTGAEVRTYRWGRPVEAILAERPDLVVHSPGPGRPADFGVPELVAALARHGVPQFGVCLGLQGIVEAFGGRLEVLDEPRHGKTWQLSHDGTGLFEGLEPGCPVGAYHSLVGAEIPEALEVVARSEGGLPMAVRHRALPVAAVQFHPESILSLRRGAGHRIVRNALAMLLRRAADRDAAE